MARCQEEEIGDKFFASLYKNKQYFLLGSYYALPRPVPSQVGNLLHAL